MTIKFFQFSKFSNNLGISSESSQCTIETIHGYLRQISGHIIGQISSQISLLRLSRGSIRIKFPFSCNCWTFSVTVTVSYWRYLTLIRRFKIESQFWNARIGFQKSVDVGDKFSSLVTRCRYWWFGFKNVTNINQPSHQNVAVLQHPLSHMWPPYISW